MIFKKRIEKEIKKGLQNNTIKTENDARIIAKKYITMDEASYEITLAITNHLPKEIKTVIKKQAYNHSWFSGKIKNVIYRDAFNRVWNKSTGKIKKGIETYKTTNSYHIDAPGGMMWSSKDGKTFVCEYRTNEEEITHLTRPETFIG